MYIVYESVGWSVGHCRRRERVFALARFVLCIIYDGNMWVSAVLGGVTLSRQQRQRRLQFAANAYACGLSYALHCTVHTHTRFTVHREQKNNRKESQQPETHTRDYINKWIKKNVHGWSRRLYRRRLLKIKTHTHKFLLDACKWNYICCVLRFLWPGV